MSCTIKFDNQGRIQRVNTPTGEESKLFKSIAKIPHVNTLEEALEIYKNTYTSDFEGLLNNNIQFVSDKGNTYESFKEALKDSSGNDIQIGLNVNAEFKPLITVSSNTNTSQLGGLVNNMIKSDIMSDTKIIEDGQTFFKAEGNDEALQLVNERIIKDEAIDNLGYENVKVFLDGRIELKDSKNTVEINDKPITIQEVRQLAPQEATKRFDKTTADEIVVNNMLLEILDTTTIPAEELTLTEKDLKLKLLDLLNAMGVKVTSISNYLQAYKQRNGVEPTAQALADIGNQVVAFKDGVIGLENLAEETAHFIVEAWDNAEIENVLRNIHKTSSYQEFAEHYRAIYAKENSNLSSEGVENLVRREILGKELAKSLKDRFSTEGKSEVQVSIMQRIYDLFIDFINSIFTTDNSRTALEQLTVKVGDLVMSQDVNNYLSLKQLSGKKFNLYSAPVSGVPSIDNKDAIVKLITKNLLEQEKSMVKLGTGSRAEVQRLTDALDKAVTLSSALELVKLSKRYAAYLSDAIQQAKSQQKTLNVEQNYVLHSLKENIVPLMERLKVVAQQDENFKTIAEDIDNVLRQIGDVNGEIANTENTIINRIVDRLMDRHSVTAPKIREDLLKALDNASKDTNMLYSWFGQVTHAHDPLLGLLGSVIADMTFEAETRFQQRAKKFQNEIKKQGYKEGDLRQFFDKEGYVTSLWDFAKFEQENDITRAELYKKYTNSTLTVDELVKQLKNKTIAPIKDKTIEEAYKKEVTEVMNSRIERTFNDNYYEAREKRYNDLGISDVTRRYMRMLSTDLGEFMAKAKTEKGLPRYRYQDRHNLDAINLRRRSAKSLFDDNGNLKNGVMLASVADSNTIESNGVFYKLNEEAPKEEGTIAFEMHKLDNAFMEEKNKQAEENGGQKMDAEKLAPRFLDELQRIEAEEGREAAVEFFLLNTTMGFSADFWNNYDTSGSMSEVLDNYIQSPEAEDIWIEAINSYKSATEKRKHIIRKYQDSKNYTNILASEIPAATRNTILELSEEIDKMYSLIYNKFSEDLSQSDDIEERTTENTPNLAYRQALADNRIKTVKEQTDFALKNMTQENRKKVSRLIDAVDDLIQNKPISEKQKTLIRRLSNKAIEDLTTDDLNQAKLKYAESKLAPYYKAFAPIGMAKFYDNLQNGNQPVIDIVTEANQREDVKLGNNFSYYEIGDLQDKNKNYIENFEGGTRQPKLSKYLNNSFVQKFAPMLDANNNPILDQEGNIQVTKNQKLYELYKTYINFQRDSLSAMNENGSQNIYLAPQISKTNVQKVQSLLKGQKGTLKDIVRDATRFRVDEMAFGEEVDGEAIAKKSNLRMLPKYFMKKLEEVNDVTDDLFYSSALFAQQAELYKSRKNRFSEFASLHDKVLNRSYPDGKAAESTNTYQMFKSYFDYNLFGVKEMKQWRVDLPMFGEVDVTKIINGFHTWLRNNSLALNVVIPATSWITAQSTIAVEKYLGQYIDKGSMNMAWKEFAKISTPAMKESFELNSESKLSIIGERFRVFDLDKRFENSIYNKAGRTFLRSGYILHTAANFVPLSVAMLSQLHGTRVYNGKLIDFNKFEEIKKLENPQGTINTTAEWIKLEDKNLYSYINVKDGDMIYDYNRLAIDMGRENNEDFVKDIKNYELGVASRVRKIIERVDGQIDASERTTLQRHVLGRFVMTHKGWLSIATSNRFKKKHFNFSTGQEEEGSYLSVFNSFTNAINLGFKEAGAKGALKNLRDVYKNGSYIEKQNMRRVLIETAVLQGIFALGLAISGFADDDGEDMLTAQMAAYLFERLTTETASSQLGVIGELYSSAKEPIVGLNKINTLIKVTDLFDSSVQTRGRYAGLTKREIYLIKNTTGAKGIFDLSSAKNLKSQRDSYDFFNKEESLIPVSYIIDEKGGDSLLEYPFY